ncbi:MAG: DegT/DnrJ/EryC1/StrS family aminotransferase [Bryobacteraceae bacterium]
MIQTQREPVRLLNLQLQYAAIRDEVMAAVERVIDSQYFILGAEVERFEEEAAAYLKTAFAVGCASGSDAIMLALAAAGIKPGEGVLTSAFSFFASAGYVVHAGATPVFCDIDPQTFNIDPAEAEVIGSRDRRIRALLPVHLYGGCADMDPLIGLAVAKEWAVVEDAAQSIGAEYKGRRALALGGFGCTSFFPSKNLGAFGDGGLVTTDSPQMAASLRALRMHGSSVKYFHETVGWNSRLDAMQAAVLRVKLKYLDEWTAGRQRNAALYTQLLDGSDVTPPRPAGYQTRHVWNQYVIRCPRRDDLRGHLAALGIGTEVYYPLPLHLQPCFTELGYREGDFPEAERAAKEVLALPIQSELTADQIEWIATSVRAFYGA